ncbi:MAG: polymer-forming cytoskeletal protein [candidate division WOR-3 bacterium]|nr:MAG: polymer-forming cytoskeletal protein [candidate division WOR-3 bacterium]
MQGLTTILLLVTAIAGQSLTTSAEYIGAMPPVEVTAMRYANEDAAWSGLMPAVEVTASRYISDDIARAEVIPAVIVNQDDFCCEDESEHSYAHAIASGIQSILVKNTRIPDLDLNMQIADLKIFGAVPGAITFSGDYHLQENDTIDEDVTVTGGNARIDGIIDGDLAVMGGTVDVNGTVEGEVAVLGGNLEITGLIDGDAAVFGGNIKNRGIIDGELHVIGGTVHLDSGSVVTGDISMVGGTVERDENAVVGGEIESVEIKALEKILPRISRAFRLPRILPGAEVFPRAVFLGMLVVLYLFNILVALIFPNATERVRTKIEESIWASIGLGIVMQLLFVPLIVLLAVSIIGIPLIILLPLAVFLATLFGLSALALIAGERVCKGFNWKIQSMLGKLSLGWLAIMLIPIVLILIGPPVFGIGFVVVYIALTIGLGGVIYTLVKRSPKETKK